MASRPARTLPHLLDSLLLLSGAWLAWIWGAALGGWFTAKMFGLVAYVLLGIAGMRPWLARRTRVAAGLSALAVVAWMASVAVTKNPLGFLAG